MAAFTTVRMRSARAESANPRRRARGVALASTARTVALCKLGSGALRHLADSRQEEPGGRELRLERRSFLPRERDEEPAGRLRVVRELDELGRDAVGLGHGVR